MAITYTNAKALNISAATDVYTVPASTTAIISYAAIGTSAGAADNLTAIAIGPDIYFRSIDVPTTGRILHELEGTILTAGQKITVTDSDAAVSVFLGIKELS